MNCLLCQTPSSLKEKETYECPRCELVFKDSRLHLNFEEDLKRYSTHQNNEFDQGYIDFLNRLVKPLEAFLPASFEALDFGCGPGPTLSTLLRDLGANAENYDPLFFDNPRAINRNYDVVTCTEVAEHFKTPAVDWDLLVSLVKPNGLLAIMTQFINADIDYASWWYKNDPTHVVFYQEKTFSFLAEKLNMKIIFSDKKSVVIFRKGEV